MNLFFFIYQELEFQNYFPIALEIKNKYKESKITFIFTERQKYEEIIKSNFINLNLKKNFDFFVYKKSKNKLIQKFMALFNIVNVIIRFTKNKKPILFFAKLSMLNQHILAKFAKFFSGKLIYLAPDRNVHPVYLIYKEWWKKTLSFNKEHISHFNFFAFYHKDNFFYRRIYDLLKKHSKIIFIGLPNLLPTWKNLVKNEAKKKIKILKKKFGPFSNIYTIIGGKDGDSRFLKTKSSQYYSIIKVVEIIKNKDPESIILFKAHPRESNPYYLKKALKKINFKNFEASFDYSDVLSLLSKRFIFTSPTGVLTHSCKVKKIDISNYKNIVHRQFYNDYKDVHYNSAAKGYNVIYIDSENLSLKNKSTKYFFDDSFFKKKEVSNKELKLLKKNKPIIEKLIKMSNQS